MNTDRSEEIIDVAQAMLDGDVGLVEGARRMTRLIGESGETDNPLFFPIIGFESETEGFVVGSSDRSKYSEDYLERSDKRLAGYLGRASGAIRETCSLIIRGLE